VEEFAAAAAAMSGVSIPPCKFVSIWGRNRREAQRKADLLGIERVSDHAEEALAESDGALILDRFADDHFESARLAISNGLPTFVDKLLSTSPLEAESLVLLAERNEVPLASFSPYRYSAAVKEFSDRVATTADDSGTLVCFGPMDCTDLAGDPRLSDICFYGIHSVEIVFSILGDSISRVASLRSAGRSSAIIEYATGVQCDLQMVSGLVGEDYRLTWYSRRASLAFAIKSDDPLLYKAAFQGVISELFVNPGTDSAHRSIKALRLLDSLRAGESQ
jgi:hypothetical protein